MKQKRSLQGCNHVKGHPDGAHREIRQIEFKEDVSKGPISGLGPDSGITGSERICADGKGQLLILWNQTRD